MEDHVVQQLSRRKVMVSTQAITKAVNAQADVQVKQPLVRKVMRKTLRLKYKSVTYVPFQTNSNRCLVLRQQFAITLLGLLAQGKRIINVDESWVDQTSYTRRHWRPVAGQPSEMLRPVTPRVSLIASVCTEGSIFLSLT